MARRVGSDDYVFELDEDWGRLPINWNFVDAAGVAVDSQDRVYVFNRGAHPVVVFDKDGALLGSWGEGIFNTAHGLHIDANGNVYCVDSADHTVRKFTSDGTLLMTLGTKDVASDTGYSGDLDTLRPGAPFNRPTNCAVAADGTIFVTDGYGNCCVHKFTPDGRLVQSWGSAGRGAGQFRLVHGICLGADGTLYVGDRQNDRVQKFSPTGEHLGQWADVRCPDDIFPTPEGHFVVAELGYQGGRSGEVGLGARVTVRDAAGNVLTAWGDDGDPTAPGNFAAPHGVALDSAGNLYVGEVTYTARVRTGKVPPHCHVFQRFVRVR